jgi:hypothetical protein
MSRGAATRPAAAVGSPAGIEVRQRPTGRRFGQRTAAASFVMQSSMAGNTGQAVLAQAVLQADDPPAALDRGRNDAQPIRTRFCLPYSLPTPSPSATRLM